MTTLHHRGASGPCPSPQHDLDSTAAKYRRQTSWRWLLTEPPQPRALLSVVLFLIGSVVFIAVRSSSRGGESTITVVSDSNLEQIHTLRPTNLSFQKLDLDYPGLKLIHQQHQQNDADAQPPVYIVDAFLTDSECDFLIDISQSCLTRAFVGGDKLSKERTSSNCYFEKESLPGLLKKVSHLVNKPLENLEYPQVGRYEKGEQFTQHFDAYGRDDPVHLKELEYGGNRLVTVLVYLNDVDEGGETQFPRLGMNVKPVKGRALVFFPSTLDGERDSMAQHAALPAVATKYVSQVWVRQGTFTGPPRKATKVLTSEEAARWS